MFSKGSLKSDLPLPIPQIYPIRALTSESFLVSACWFQAEHNMPQRFSGLLSSPKCGPMCILELYYYVFWTCLPRSSELFSHFYFHSVTETTISSNSGIAMSTLPTPMIRSNSRSKWKEVLGFDDGDGISAYPSPPSSPSRSPPASSIYSGFREKLRPSTARSRDTSSRPPSRESFWSRSHTRSHTNQSRITEGSTKSREPFWSRSHARSHTTQSKETFRPDTSHSRPYTSPTEANYPSYPRFPKDITFYRSKSDILLSPSPPAPSTNDIKPLPPPPPQFYITIQKDNSTSPISTSRPDVLLHSGPEKASTVLSFAKFHSVTQATEITLCPPAPKPISANFSQTSLSLPFGSRGGEEKEKEQGRPKFKIEVLTPSGGIFTTEKYSFFHTLQNTREREKFEWKYTSGPFVRTIESARESGGLKLIRTSTGDVVAVYAGLGPSSRASNPSRVMGMFRFLRGEGTAGLSGEFEALAVMSILAIVERNRRVTKAHKQAFQLPS